MREKALVRDCAKRDSLLQALHVPPLHDGLVAVVDVDTQEDADGVIATIHMLLNVALERERRERAQKQLRNEIEIPL